MSPNGSLNRVADFPRSVFIAKQFGVDPGTVQRISRPFDRVGIVSPSRQGRKTRHMILSVSSWAIEAADAGLTGFGTFQVYPKDLRTLPRH